MIPELGTIPPLYLGLAILFVVSLLLGRVPVLGTAIRLAVWVGLAIVLVNVAGQRQRLDPYIGRFLDRLNMDSQQVVGDEVRIKMSPDGHFWARAKIGGLDRRMLVDSGATVTALSSATAEQAGLKVRDEVFPVLIRTANGTITARTSTVPELWLGDIVARDLAVIVSPAFGEVDVLGMNFLSKLKSWRVEGSTLILVPNHPQKPRDSEAPRRPRPAGA
ncbi:MAG: family clan aspartic protease [Sphingomonas bacterium]|nr:TIGR02281 family clan AA aspartic protease [Sphingomonas bacterium]MDB5688787.1 family clan aspartic protease [Sphingomonas bacterium]